MQFVERQFVGRIAVARRTRQSDTRDDSSDESWWRVGRANPDMRAEAVKATSRLEVTRGKPFRQATTLRARGIGAWHRPCLRKGVPGSAPIALRERKNAWHRSHRVPGRLR